MVAQATGFINNEQQNAAQVNNNESKSTQMEEINNQSSIAPQVGANETAIGNAKDAAVSDNKPKATYKKCPNKTNMVGNNPFLLVRTGLTKLFNPELEQPFSMGSIYNVALSTNSRRYKKLCCKPSLLKKQTIGVLLGMENFYGPFRINQFGNHIPFDVDYNYRCFGSEFNNTVNPDSGIYKRVDEEGYINLFTDKVKYIDIYHYDKALSKYAPLNTLPKVLSSWLQPNGSIHGKLELDYALDEPYVIDFDFTTTNDVLTEIKKAYVKMHERYIKPNGAPPYYMHSIIYLKVEILRFNPKTGYFKVFIGS